MIQARDSPLAAQRFPLGLTLPIAIGRRNPTSSPARSSAMAVLRNADPNPLERFNYQPLVRASDYFFMKYSYLFRM